MFRVLNYFIPFFLFTFLCFISYGQGDRFKRNNYKWETLAPLPIAVTEKFKNEDAVILEEENVIWLFPKSNSKHIRIKYLTQKGIEKNSDFILPESYDPLAEKYGIEYSVRDSIFRPKGEYNSLLYFTGRIIKPDGRVLNAAYIYTNQDEMLRYDQIDHHYYSWMFHIIGLEPGDELELRYAMQGSEDTGENFNRVYSRIFDPKGVDKFEEVDLSYAMENVFGAMHNQYRVYFHGTLPKQSYELKIRHKNGDLFLFQNHNGAAIIDTVLNKNTSPQSIEYTWRANNLEGCIAEKGARIHRELPFVTFYQHHHDYTDKGMDVFYDAKALPYPWEYVYKSMVGIYPKHPDYYLNKQTLTARALRKYFYEISQKAKDTSAFSKYLAFHNDVLDNFEYDNDIKYIADDAGLEKLGRNIESKKLKSRSRYNLYAEIGLRLASPYYETNLYDKRYEEMDFNLFYPMEISQSFLVLPYKNSYMFFLPKYSRFGYECNELPFYYEDVNAMLIPQTFPEDGLYKATQQINYVRLKTPASTQNDNTRNTNCLVTVSPDQGSVVFDTRLLLSGQFSTLTRSYYQYGITDTTINKAYYLPVYQLNGSAKLISSEMTSQNRNFPFTAGFKIKYSADKLIKKIEPQTMELPLQGFFNNVIESIDTVHIRHLCYYPDFQFSDQHKYVIKFDKAVELTNSDFFNFNIVNSFGEYSCSLKKMDENIWALETVYQVKAEKVSPENFKDVISIYSAIYKMNNSCLRWTLK